MSEVKRKNHDRRVGGIDFAIRRIAGEIRRQIGARGIDRRLNVTGRAVDVAVQIELQRDGCRAEGARRSHFVDARDVTELPFERAATDEAIISGLAPGKTRQTLMVGKSTCGNGATGNCRCRPPRRPGQSPAVSSDVPTGTSV